VEWDLSQAMKLPTARLVASARAPNSADILLLERERLEGAPRACTLGWMLVCATACSSPLLYMDVPGFVRWLWGYWLSISFNFFPFDCGFKLPLGCRDL